MDQQTLARIADVSDMTIKRLEASRDGVRAHVRTIEKITRALQEAGIVFIAADEHGGPGVRLRDQ
jgi:predicted transcriptional regulator